MKISLEWLSDFIRLIETDPKQIAATLTEKTAEIDAVIVTGGQFENVVTGKILEIASHPDADKIRVTQTDVGDGQPRQIICGAKNIEVGQVVPVALPGAVLPGNFVIEKRKMRGVSSEGMLCSGKELGLGDDAAGIMILDVNTKIGIPFAETIGSADTVFDIDNPAITNRPDLFSQLGFARELVATGLAEWKCKQYDFSGVESKIPDSPLPVAFDVQKPEICPTRAEIVVENLTVAESPDWLKHRLKACGIRAINNVVDISNYVMLETGMPLHIFDLDRLVGDTIVMRESVKGEQVVTLDGKTRELPEGVIIQQDANGIFDLAGIMGGANSEIIPQTKRVLIHVPVYDPVRIRKAALALAHRTDASTIYEKRVPNASVLPGLLRTVQLLDELCPAMRIVSRIEHVEHVPSPPISITLPLAPVNRVLGEEIGLEAVTSILNKLDFTVSAAGNETLEVAVPPHRFGDIAIPDDLVEEIVRIHGLNTLHAKAPTVSMRPAPLSPLRSIRREASDFLVGQGMYECVNYAFLGETLLSKCGWQIDDDTVIRIENPISAEMSIMRQSLLPRLLEKAAENRKHFAEFRLFEIGKTFFRRSNTEKEEVTELAAVLVGDDYPTAKGILEGLAETLGLTLRIVSAETVIPAAQAGANILLGNSVIGQLFEFGSAAKKQFALPDDASGLFLDLSVLAEMPRKQKKINATPRFPAIELDLSVLADSETFAEEVVKPVKKIDPLVESVEVTEIYEGEGVPAGKKSITLRFRFRANDRTMSSEEADRLRDAILKKLADRGFPFRF